MLELTFQEHVKLALIDRLAFGGVVAALGFAGNWILERHKGRQALVTELAKTRVKEIESVWSHFTSLTTKASSTAAAVLTFARNETREPAVNDSLLHPLPLRQQIRSKFGKRLDILKRRQNALTDSLVSRQFWLGESIARQLVVRSGTLRQYIDAIEFGDEPTLRDLAHRLRDSAEDVASVVRKL